MSDYQVVCKTSEIPAGEGRSFVVGEKVVGIFRQGDEYFAIDDGCPHMAASLSTGYFDDYVVTCPLHAWRFDVRDGSWCDNPRVKTNTYALKVVGDEVQISIEEKPVDDSSDES